MGAVPHSVRRLTRAAVFAALPATALSVRGEGSRGCLFKRHPQDSLPAGSVSLLRVSAEFFQGEVDCLLVSLLPKSRSPGKGRAAAVNRHSAESQVPQTTRTLGKHKPCRLGVYGSTTGKVDSQGVTPRRRNRHLQRCLNGSGCAGRRFCGFNLPQDRGLLFGQSLPVIPFPMPQVVKVRAAIRCSAGPLSVGRMRGITPV